MIAIVERIKTSKPIQLVTDNLLRVSPAVASGMLSVGSMSISASAADDISTGTFDTVLSYAGKALNFCTSNDVMATIFYCSLAGAVFYVIRCARKSVR